MKNIIEQVYNYMANDDKVVAIYGDMKSKDKSLTYGEIKKCIVAIHKLIGRDNFKKSVGILIENRLEFIKAFFSGIYNGYTIVAIDPKITDEGLDKIINDNKLTTVISNNSNIDKIKRYSNINAINIEEIEITDERKFELVNSNLDDIIVVSYTSGTSGKFSKGVKLSNKNISFVSEESRFE